MCGSMSLFAYKCFLLLFATFVVISKCLAVTVMPYFLSMHYPVMTSAFDHIQAFILYRVGKKFYTTLITSYI